MLNKVTSKPFTKTWLNKNIGAQHSKVDGTIRQTARCEGSPPPPHSSLRSYIMHTDDVQFLIGGLFFIAFSLANAWYLHWIPYSAPPVLLLLGLGAYSIWEAKHGNKT